MLTNIRDYSARAVQGFFDYRKNEMNKKLYGVIL